MANTNSTQHAELAAQNGLPVVNALTDFLHPCQIYADAFTAAERWAGPDDRTHPVMERP